jgi:hypothetical protein
MSVIRTHNAWHLGDHLIQLNFMRRAAQANPDHTFIHHAANQYLAQLRDVVEGVPNLKLEEFTPMTPPDSIDSWRGAVQSWHQGWHVHPDRNDFVKYHLQWFAAMASRMKIENPIKEPKDMLFDYPNIPLSPVPASFTGNFDVLVINSAPGSGQWLNYNEPALINIAGAMAAKGFKVICTTAVPIAGVLSTTTEHLSVTQIGQLSLHCPTILMVSTGPSWPTFNIWNLESVKNRIILLTEERIYLTPNTYHCSELSEAAKILQRIGLL